VPKLVPILEFAYRIGFTTLYDAQARVLLRYEGGDPVAAACAIGSVSSASPSMSLVIDDSVAAAVNIVPITTARISQRSGGATLDCLEATVLCTARTG
jgi:hypothetical protein